ncbi:MAG: O-antigen ligase family protein [Microcoleus sp.]
MGSSEIPLDPAILKLRYVMVGASILILLLMSGFNKLNFSNKSLPILLLWILFSFAIVTSGIANNDSSVVRDGFWLMLGANFIFFYALPNLMKEQANLLLGLALFLGNVPYLVTSLVSHPLTTLRYKGIFANPNQMGLIGATVAAGILIVLSGALSAKKSSSYIWVIILLLLLNFYIILCANSRTSILAFCAMFGLFIYQSLSNPEILYKMGTIFIAIFSGMVVIGTEQINVVLKEVDGILGDKVQGGLSGRDDIWKQTLNDASWLGYGSDYFEFNFGMGGHNSMIEILGQNGIIAAYFLIFFAIASFYYAYRYFKNYAKEDSYAIAPLIIAACFWILSMGEGMFGSLGTAMTLAYMISIGIVMAKR